MEAFWPPRARVVADANLMCKTAVAVEIHRCMAAFSQTGLSETLVLSLQAAPKTGPERAFGRSSRCAPTSARDLDRRGRVRPRTRQVEHPTPDHLPTGRGPVQLSFWLGPPLPVVIRLRKLSLI